MRRVVLVMLLVFLLSLGTACGTPASTSGVPAPDSSSSSALSTTAPSDSSGSASAARTPGAPERVTELQVFAAASLTNAFREIGQRFDAANNTKTVFNFAGSQQLAQQIAQGAPADVFASAHHTQMEKLIETGQISSGTQQIFVRNRLVLIHPHDNPARLMALTDLAKPGVKLVLAVKEVPVGQYSLNFLRKASELPQFTASYSETALRNVVSYEENVRVVLSKVRLGEADAGIVYTSDISHDAMNSVGRIDIPDPLNTVAAYPIAPLRDSKNAPLAERFVEYLLSPEGQGIMTNYGFLPAKP